MTPRIISAWILLIGPSLPAAPAISPDYLPPTVGVLLSFQHPPPGYYVQQFQRDVARIFRPSRLDLRWQILDNNTQPGVYSRVVVVELRGRCGYNRLPTVAPNREPNVRLGWTTWNDGEVIPHVTIDCDRIAAVISQARTQISNRLILPDLYQRLTARVMVHELMHVLLRSADHDSSDCLKTPLRLADFQTPPRLSVHNLQALRDVGRPGAPALAQTK